MGGYVLLQVHDEVVCEVPEDYAPMAARVVEVLMEGFVNPRMRCPMKVDAHVGINWADAKG